MEVQEKSICVGTGLVALDVVVTGDAVKDADFLAGGSCGNVLTILSYLGWSSYPIARLSNNFATELLLDDLTRWQVNDSLLTVSETGSTPIIIHRIMKDKMGLPKHRFEFRNPEDGKHLPAYKPTRGKDAQDIFQKQSKAEVFYFDRINRGSIDLAKFYKEKGAIIFFEPSSVKDVKGFEECMMLADVVKFSDDRIPNFEDYYSIGTAPLEIQTLGKDGLKYRKKGEQFWKYVDGFQIDNTVDTAGAGDWCTAYIIHHLFREKKSIPLTTEKIEYALRFGQALSAMNCTFEGARGLMYYIKPSELLLYVEHCVSVNSVKISQNTSRGSIKQKFSQVSIGSLFAKT